MVYLDTTYTIVSDTTNNEMCDTFDNNPNCTLASTTCIDGPATKNINGLDVYKDCWQWKKDYLCAATELTSTCQICKTIRTARKPGRFVSIRSRVALVVCWSTSSRCTISPARRSRQKPIAVCRRSVSTVVVLTRGSLPDGDSGLAITNMEAMREAASYGLFVGEENECHSNMLVNCCKSEGGGQGAKRCDCSVDHWYDGPEGRG